MPTVRDMSEWYIAVKKEELTDMIEKHQILVQNIQTLQEHVLQCQQALDTKTGSEEGVTNDGNTISSGVVSND